MILFSNDFYRKQIKLSYQKLNQNKISHLIGGFIKSNFFLRFQPLISDSRFWDSLLVSNCSVYKTLSTFFDLVYAPPFPEPCS
ncbi:MAG: hypothetical protein A3C71_02460 [Candidatus Yanofskybacteria bacterium RIFCSPHIGHO2_02_FULL_43_15c]|uniref:Uncharacterized protein n=1 Tax=Candidatus Yanofskybacteria bacterium RIFCSPHIGHO2_02_FULL_43_15c TaxID=1802679 RepID=A0A1F8FLD2_9BACT|nr:MAG: hypothetical protein A3C71_02460 [Candidatus Yanofskybacteria bacterium RIFCSPHIGHO2_02_FULL_43_15c]